MDTEERIERKPQPKLRLLILSLASISGAIAVYVLWNLDPSAESWINRFNRIVEFLAARPWALVLAVMILPGIGFPSSPLLVFFGIALSPQYGMALTCFLGVFALSVCTTWTYLLSAGPLREILKRLVCRYIKIPEPTEENMLRIGLIFRLTPGIPYPFQNIALGVLGMSLRPYLIVSLPISALWTVAFIVTGGAIFKGSTGLAISGILLAIVLIITTKMLLKRAKRNGR